MLKIDDQRIEELADRPPGPESGFIFEHVGRPRDCAAEANTVPTELTARIREVI
jgi:hypothetical protein